MSYTTWINLENELPVHVKNGVAFPYEKKNNDYRKITNKQQCIEWYSTIEFNPPLDYTLIDWDLTKEAEYELLKSHK
jgi:hypothetical protein